MENLYSNTMKIVCQTRELWFKWNIMCQNDTFNRLLNKVPTDLLAMSLSLAKQKHLNGITNTHS